MATGKPVGPVLCMSDDADAVIAAIVDDNPGQEVTIVDRGAYTRVSGDGELEKITYVQHTPVLRLPEIVTIQFFPVGEHGSSFAIESHSRYGPTDLGDNKQRVLSWVAMLQRVAEAHHAP